ncbi:MAG: hypothetical protein ACLRYD_16140 [Ruminococcus callidus]
MSKIQVEVSFTDELESIRVDGKEMEIPKAIKTKPVEEWFEPTVGRVRWGGLGAEIKEMDFSNERKMPCTASCLLARKIKSRSL